MVNDPSYEKTAKLLEKENLPTVRLEVIYMPEVQVHKHVIIAISGFLSEKSNQSEDWEHLKQ